MELYHRKTKNATAWEYYFAAKRKKHSEGRKIAREAGAEKETAEIMELLFAPMEGLTNRVYRELHHSLFPGISRYYAPFVSPTADHGIQHRGWEELRPENNRGIRLVPQLLTNRAEDFIWAASLLRDWGYEEVNLNLGCPSGTVVAKKKGSGFLGLPDELERFLEEVWSAPELRDMKLSVKARIGLTEVGEFDRLLEIFRRFPMHELILHPRLRRDMYQGGLHEECFAAAVEACPFPLVWNGDIFTPEDLKRRTEQYPGLRSVMLGRGMIAEPCLAARCLGLEGWESVRRETLLDYHSALCELYRSVLYGDRAVCQKMKEHWFYLIRHFGDGAKHYKRICKAQRYDEYRLAAEAALKELPLLPDTVWQA